MSGGELAWGIVFSKYGDLGKTETGPFIFPDGEFANETDKVSFGNCEIVYTFPKVTRSNARAVYRVPYPSQNWKKVVTSIHVTARQQGLCKRYLPIKAVSSTIQRAIWNDKMLCSTATKKINCSFYLKISVIQLKKRDD